MTSTDTRTADPAQPHPAENGGHELSDFSFTSVYWMVPLAVITLVGFTLVVLFWFRGIKDDEIALKQSQYVPEQLNAYMTRQHEILNTYKILDKEAGRVRIPVARAMELLAQENQGKPGRAWTPITDTYLEGAAFQAPAAATLAPKSSAAVSDGSGIQVEDVPTKPSASKKMAAGRHAESREAAPSQAPGKK